MKGFTDIYASSRGGPLHPNGPWESVYSTGFINEILLEGRKRKYPLVTGEYYHVFNKSIAGYRIFNGDLQYRRMVCSIQYYQYSNLNYCFSDFLRFKRVEREGFHKSLHLKRTKYSRLVEVIAYCIMSTHIHLALKQLLDNGISIFMGNILNSYARYFNRKHKRFGPLWAGRFQDVIIDSDEQLWHLSKYVHLNPTTAGLIDKPHNWIYSSYLEYLDVINQEERISQWEDVMELTPCEYKKFVNDQIDYQRKRDSLNI